MIEITLIDKKLSKIIQVDEHLLSKNSTYFAKYFTQPIPYTHKVVDISIAESIIAELQTTIDIPNMCKTAFETMLQIDITVTNLKKITPEMIKIMQCVKYKLPIQIQQDIVMNNTNIILLLKLITEILPYNANSIKVLINNIPDDYNFYNLPCNVLIDMIQHSYYDSILVAVGKKIIMIENNNIVKTSKLPFHRKDAEIAKIIVCNDIQKPECSRTYHGIIYADTNFQLYFWKSNTKRIKNAFTNGHTDRITSLAINDKYVVSSSIDRTIKIWQLKDFQLKHTLNDDCIVALVKITPYDENVISLNITGVIKIWDVHTGKLECTISDKIRTFALIHCDIVTRSDAIKIWNIKGELIKTIVMDEPIKHLIVSECKEITIVGISADKIKRWSFDGTFIDIWYNIEVDKISLSSDQTKMYITDNSNNVKTWDVQNDAIRTIGIPGKIADMAVMKNRSNLTDKLLKYI